MRRVAPLILAGLVLAACGSGSDESGDAGSTTAPAASASTSIAPDEGSAVVTADAREALRFSSPLVGGGDIELTTLAGRPVLLWFWAPW